MCYLVLFKGHASRPLLFLCVAFFLSFFDAHCVHFSLFNNPSLNHPCCRAASRDKAMYLLGVEAFIHK